MVVSEGFTVKRKYVNRGFGLPNPRRQILGGRNFLRQFEGTPWRRSFASRIPCAGAFFQGSLTVLKLGFGLRVRALPKACRGLFAVQYVGCQRNFTRQTPQQTIEKYIVRSTVVNAAGVSQDAARFLHGLQ